MLQRLNQCSQNVWNTFGRSSTSLSLHRSFAELKLGFIASTKSILKADLFYYISASASKQDDAALSTLY